MIYEAEIVVPAAHVRVVRLDFPHRIESRMRQDEGYWLDLSITPRAPNARLRFHDRWAAHRFEPPGRLFLLPPDEEVRARSDRGTQTSVICVLPHDAFSRWLGHDLEWTERRVEASLDLRGGVVPQLLLRLAEEARRPGFASAALCEAIAVQIAVELNRYYLGIEDEPAAGGLPGWRLRRIEERLREVRTPPTLSELADLCGLSVRQLTRGFRGSRGRSIGDHIADTRIEVAKRLLDADESVKAIAGTLGFGSSSSFCHAFRRATGRTPLDFRAQAAALRRQGLN